MKRAVFVCVASLVLSIAAFLTLSSRAQAQRTRERAEPLEPLSIDRPEARFRPGEILVKFRDAADAGEVLARGTVSAGRRPRLAALLSGYGLARGQRLSRTRHRRLDQWFRFSSPRLESNPALLERVLADLRARPEVEYAEPNAIAHATWIPNDPYYQSSGSWGQSFEDLWGLHKIEAAAAWDQSRGATVVVAVLDTGVDASHPDIAEQIWRNPGETGANRETNGIDDDGNGFVDDSWGFDFSGYPWDNNPSDDYGHGTHVAGTIAASGDNGLGIAGVAPLARVMSVKVLDRFGSGSAYEIAAGIDYAIRNGAKVINLSLAGFGETPQALADVIGYAHDVMGVVVVASAGNSGTDVGTAGYGFWPANLRDVVTVGASNHDDVRASFSNYGAKLDLVAPGGGDTGSGYQPSRSILSLLSSNASSSLTGSGQLVVGGQYLRQSGTSMAAPHVSGVAALVRALYPALTPEQVRQALRSGADDLGAVGFDTTHGYGRVNAATALAFPAPLAVQITTSSSTFGAAGAFPLVEGTAAGPDLAFWTLEYGAGTAPSSWNLIASSTTPVVEGLLASWDISGVPDGAYSIRLHAETGTGLAYEDRLAVTVDNVQITSPVSGETASFFRGGETISLYGSVSPASFVSFTLTVTGKRTGVFANPALTLAGNGLQPVVNGLIGSWDTTGVLADHYQVCVKVTTAAGTIQECTFALVDPDVHAGWPRSLGGSYYILDDHLTAEDIDGDGKKDLLVSVGGKVQVLDHGGNSLPGWPQTIGNAYDGVFTGPVAGDMTGDAELEVVAATPQGDVFVWSKEGTLLPGWPRPLTGDYPTLALADANGDGANEIVASDWGPVTAPQAGTLSVTAVDGSPLPGWPISFPGSPLGPVSVGDIDDDGSNELVVMTMKPTMVLHAFRMDGTPVPGWPRVVHTAGYNYISRFAPALGDLDRNGALEIVVVTPDGKVHAYRGDGSPLPGWPKQTESTSYLNAPAVGDLDGDGYLDVVAGGSSYGWNYLYAWSRTGALLPGWPRLIVPEIPIYSFFGYGAAAIVDADFDLYPDVIASSDVSMPQSFGLNAYRYDAYPASGFPRPTRSLGASPTNTPSFADLDGDGKLEMAWIDIDADLWVWDLPASSSAKAPWPMFRHDARHTGAVPSSVHRLVVSVTGTDGASGSVASSPSGISCSVDGSTPNRTCTGSFTSGAVVSLTATPGGYSAFVEWGGACTGSGPCSVTMSASRSVTASFRVTNLAPVAVPGGPYTGRKGEAIAFDGSSSSDPEGAALSYSWTFGDGSSGTGATPSHAYATGGTFVATLTVNDGVRTSAPATTNVVVIDDQPPAAVTNLAAVLSTNRKATLSWTATGDDGLVGTASRYDLRYSTSPLTEESFASAFQVQEEPAPKAPGGAETMVVGSLLPGNTYHFALRVLDGAGNASPLSNVVSVTTAPGDVLYRDDFEAGLGGWTIAGSDGKGGPSLWHLSPHRVASPAQALYYGIESTTKYNTGARNSGTITSGEINLKGAQKPVLSFQHFLQKEASTNFDVARLSVAANGSSTFTSLATFATLSRMTPFEIPLDAYNRGTLRLRFEFDTVDTISNDYEGWVLDDVTITADSVGPVAVPGGPYSGFKRQPIAFDGSGSFDPEDDPLTYSWDFGDGATGEGPTPTHPYETAGTFTATLRVSDGTSTSAAATATVTISNRPPIANAGGPYTGVEGQPIAFSGLGSTDPDGDSLTYSWSFGDGGTATGPTPTHTYASAAFWPVVLIVNDGTSGASATTTAAVTDATPPSPVANLSAVLGANRSVTLSWTATGDDGMSGTATRYDVRHSTAPLTEETFAAAFQVQEEPTPKAPGGSESMTVASLLPGTTYFFALRVVDSSGNSSSLSNVVSVTTSPGVVLLRDDFEAGFSGWIVAGYDGVGGPSLWHLSPHRVSSPTQAAYYGIETKKTYNSGARNSGSITSGEINLRGAQKPVLSFQHFLQRESSANYDIARVSVAANGSGTWTSIFQPTAANRMTPAAIDLSIYNRGTVRLKFEFDTVDSAYNDYVGWVVDDVMVLADSQGPLALPGGPYTAYKRQSVLFDGSASLDPEGDPLTYSWDFGDGTTGEGVRPTHSYETAGTFTVTLRVSDGATTSPAATASATISNRAPTANPGGPYSGSRNVAVVFDGTASSDPDGDALTYQWTFGDGTTGTGPTPSHAYSSIGTRTVTLRVHDGTTSSTTVSTSVTISNLAPIAAAGGPYSGVRNEPVAFGGGGSIDPDGDSLTYAWDFGDGATGTGPTPSHAYASLGNFTVSLVVNDGIDPSPPSTSSVTISNRVPLAAAGGPYSGVRNEPIAFNGEGSSDPDGDGLTYAWDFGDGSTGSGPAPSHAYTSLGTFPVSLVVNDGNDPSPPSTSSVTISNLPPLVALTSPPEGAIFTAPAQILLAASASDPDGAVVRVDYFDGEVKIGESGASPQSFLWSGAGVGPHILSARAVDDSGASTTSPPVSILVNAPPAVGLTSPAPGAYSSPASLTLTAEASDLDGAVTEVEFFQGTTSLGKVTTSPHTISWGPVPPGSYSLTARATDDRGAITVSDPVLVKVTARLAVSADAYVRDGSSAGSKFGGSTALQVKTTGSTGNTRWTYLKVDLSSVPSIESARLRLFGRLSSTTSATVVTEVYPAADTAWSETLITWNTKPAIGSPSIASVVMVNTSTTARWYEWDLTSYLSQQKSLGRNVVTLVLKNAANSNPYATFNSKEASANKPELFIVP